jgi:hypothetical protein
MRKRTDLGRLLRGKNTGSKKLFVREVHTFLRKKRSFPFTEETRGSIPLRATFLFCCKDATLAPSPRLRYSKYV